MKEIEFYKQIPASVCRGGCFDCCRHQIQFTKEEEKAMGGYTCEGSCSHLVNGECSVYERRPFVCRLYGASEMLRCDGCTPERYLTEEETKRLVHEYVTVKKEQESGK